MEPTLVAATGQPRREAVAGRKTSLYLPALDAARCVGFFCMFLAHSHGYGSPEVVALLNRPVLHAVVGSIYLSGAVAIPWFFMLSAYLITMLLMRERELTGRINIRAFYMRRILRLWPAYLLALLIGFLGAWFVAHDHDLRWFAASLLMVGNWASIHSIGTRSPLPLVHLWSISVEEQFYLVFPVLASILSRRGLRWFSLGLAATSVVVLYHLPVLPFFTVWFNSFVQFLFFAIGIFLGLRYPISSAPGWSRPMRYSLLIGAVLLTIVVQFSLQIPIDSAPHLKMTAEFLLMGAACCGFLLFLLDCTGSPPRWMVFLGQITLGLYLYHQGAQSLAQFLLRSLAPTSWAFVILKDVLGLSFTIAAAMLSYYVLELRFLKVKVGTRFTVVPSHPAS